MTLREHLAWRLAAVLAALITAAALWATISAGASADNDWIQFGEQSAVINFPDDMVFSLEFSAERPVTRASLSFHIIGQDSGRIEPAAIHEGDLSTAEFTLRTRGGSSTFIPPGAVMTYRWIIEDQDGNRAESQPTELLYTDTRFEWNTVSRDNITVHYNGPTRTRAETILDASAVTLGNMGRLLNAELNRDVNVVMYNNPVQMKDALPFISQASSSGLVTQGQAYGKEGVLLINGFDSQIEGIVSHEVTHLLVAQAGEGPGKRVPDWLNEGLAEYGNIQPGVSYDLAVLRAVRTDTLYPLVQLANRPGEPEAVIVFYGHSRQVVDFMIDTFGADKMSQLLQEFRDGDLNFEDTLEKVYGHTLTEIDNMWRDSLGLPHVSTERIGNRPASAVPTPRPTLPPLGAPTATPLPTAPPPPTATPPPAPPPDSSEGGNGYLWLLLLLLLVPASALGLFLLRRRYGRASADIRPPAGPAAD